MKFKRKHEDRQERGVGTKRETERGKVKSDTNEIKGSFKERKNQR